MSRVGKTRYTLTRPQYKTVTSTTLTKVSGTTAYASGDLIANHATAASVVPLTFTDATVRVPGEIAIWRARLIKSSPVVTNGSFRIHFFNASPAFDNGDNGVFSVTGDGTSWIGACDIVQSTFAALYSAAAVGDGKPVNTDFAVGYLTTANMYGAIEARAAYTPITLETFIVKATIQQL